MPFRALTLHVSGILFSLLFYNVESVTGLDILKIPIINLPFRLKKFMVLIVKLVTKSQR